MAGKSKFTIEAEDATARAWKSVGDQAKKTSEQVSHVWEAAFAGISVAAIAELGKKAFEIGDQISKAATKAGIGGKAFSELAYAAKLADVDVTGLSTGIKKMQVALSEASTGAKAPNDALAALGLKFKDIRALKPEDQFELLADRISGLKDPADRARAATDLFGRAGADLLPLFEKGAAGISKARHEAEELGVSFGDEQLKKLADAEEAIKHLSAAWQGFYMTLATKVAPTVANVLDSLAGSRTAELKQQIAFLEKVQGEGFVAANPLGSHGAFKDIGTGVFSAEEGQAMLEKLRGQLDLRENLHPELGGRGRPTGAPGFAAADQVEKAAAAQKKMNEADDARRARISDTSADFSELYRTVNSEADRTLHNDMEREVKRQDAAAETYEKWKQSERDLAIWRDEQAAASAKQFTDVFNGAFDAMEQNGHLSAKRFFTYLGAELLQLATSKLLTNLFSGIGGGAGSGSSAGGGFWSAVGSVFSSAFGGGKASGGDVSAGQTYVVGENGRELLHMGSSGSITPNNKLGGNITIAPVTHITTTADSNTLPQILRENNRNLVDQLMRSGALRPA